MKLGQLLDMLRSSKTIRIVDIDSEPIADYTRKNWRIRARLEKTFKDVDNLLDSDVVGVEVKDDEVEVVVNQ